MPRPCCKRRVDLSLDCAYFVPRGVPLCRLEVLTLTLDETEALRLADYEGLYQAAAAARMGVSRATFGRIVESARRKVADALVHGRALRIDGGNVEPDARASLRTCGADTTLAPDGGGGACSLLRHGASHARGAARPERCPHAEVNHALAPAAADERHN